MDALAARLPARLVYEWMAYDQIAPIDHGWRGDRQAGMLASLIANVYRDPKSRPEPYEVTDFMPEWGVEKAKQREPGELWREVRTWAMLNRNSRVAN